MADKIETQENLVGLEEVPTQFGLAYRLPDGKQVTEPEYLVWLGNLVYKISKSIA